MKDLIINSSMRYITKNNNYSDTTIKEIKYGLESIYLSISKVLIISLIAYFLGFLKEMLIFTLMYNIVRMFSFGLHATKSWICLISSTIAFIGIPYLCIVAYIPIEIKEILCIACILLMYKNSPADTYKRPIVSKRRRQKYKFLSVIIVILFSFISIIIKDNFLSNCLIASMILQNFMISPTAYKIFGLPYNNYINFLKKHPKFTE